MKMISWQTRALTGCIFLPVESCKPIRSTGFKIICSFPPCRSLEILSPLFPSLFHLSLLCRLTFSLSLPHFCSRSRMRVYFYAALLRHLVAAHSARGREKRKSPLPTTIHSASARIIAASLASVIRGANSNWRQVQRTMSDIDNKPETLNTDPLACD